MKKQILVVGASGATGRLLVEQLLSRGLSVTVVARSPEGLPDLIKKNENVSVIQASVLELSDSEMDQLVYGCVAVVSCLGHNMSLKGIYGHPRRLVTDATLVLCHQGKPACADNQVHTHEYNRQP